MRRALTAAILFGLLTAMPLGAQEPAQSPVPSTPLPRPQVLPWPASIATTAPPGGPANAPIQFEVPAWETVWGVVALRFIPAGPKTAPNGEIYHPNFSLDLDFNFWIWKAARLYMFADPRLWGERGEYGVTNARDGFLGTSKREFDLSGGAAWNYCGFWELRAYGYTNNNLNRGTNMITPVGFTDGFGLENRYYLSQEYANLGKTGFDVTRATFVSIGYLPSKVLVGNNGQQFKPGLTMRAYLTYDIWTLPCYLYGDFQYIGEQGVMPRLLLFDVGLAARPFRAHPQWELRAGTESTADVQARDCQSLWYGAIRFIF